MKRILCILAAGVFLLCCGCQNAKTLQDTVDFPTEFSSAVHIVHKNAEFDADCIYQADGTVTLQMQSPEALRTMTFVQTKESCTVQFLGLELKTPELLLPDSAFVKLLSAAVESAKSGTRCAVSTEGDCRIYSGMTEAGDTFRLEQGRQDGALRTLTMDGQDLTVTFSDFVRM